MRKEISNHPSTTQSDNALRAENERLRAENAYLKKLQALIQDKKKSPNKTKRK
jgi:transposase